MNNNLKFENINTIVNLANSILKHYGADTFHNTIPKVDEVLKDHKKVVVMLFDGMGNALIKKHLKENGFVRRHYLHTMEATFPPTTVASTNGFLSAKFPIENGWFGWRQYFDEYQTPIKVFLNQDCNTGAIIRNRNNSILMEKCPYNSICKLIEKASPMTKAYDMKWAKAGDPEGNKTLIGGARRLSKALKHENCFVYFYWGNPDHLIHEKGTGSYLVKLMMRHIEAFIKHMVKKHPDTLFLTIADHGLTNTSFIHIYEHSDLVSCFKKEPTFEGRATNFFINDGDKKRFEDLFDKYYGDKFILLNKDEYLSKHVFGSGDLLRSAESFLGDYLAIAISDQSFMLDKAIEKKMKLKAHHAGFTKEEMLIDISIFNQ